MKRFYIFVIGLMCMMALTADAGAVSVGWLLIEPDSTEPLSVKHKTFFTLEGDAQAQSGGLSTAYTSLLLEKKYKVQKQLPVTVGINVDHYVLNDKTSVDLPASLQSKGVNVGAKFPMPFVQGDRYFMALDVGGFFQSAKDHDFDSSAFRVKTRLLGIYKPDENFIFVAGGTWKPDYEDETFSPLVGIKYVINDRWTLNMLTDRPHVAYKVSDKTMLKIEAGTMSDEFEVTRGSRKGNIVKIAEMYTGLGIEHELMDDVMVSGNIGWMFNRKYEYLEGGKVVPDDALYIGYTLSAKF